jgi:hypothetical protein
MSRNVIARLLSKQLAPAMVAAACLPLFLAQKAVSAESASVTSFTTAVGRPQHQGTDIDYTVDPRSSKFFVYQPANYIPSQAFGLIVYISPADSFERLPEGWAEVLERRRLLFVCPQNAGNNCQGGPRTGLAVLGALEMMRNYNVDKNRVYAAGLSGGARIASTLGLVQSDIFCGTIQNCGTDFYHDVQRRYATSDTDTNGHHYGVTGATPSEIAQSRAKTKFVLITGSGDFRRGNILDIYNGGYAQERFRAKLIDVAGMGHQDCDGKTLEEALDFLR